MVTIPEFVELISQKIDIQTDVNSLRKKQTAIRNEITKYNGNLLQTEKRLTELDIADRHYQNKVDSLDVLTKWLTKVKCSGIVYLARAPYNERSKRMNTIQELQKLREELIREIDEKFDWIIDEVKKESVPSRQKESRKPRNYEIIYPLNVGAGIFKGKRPTGVIFADGRRTENPTWKSVAEELLKDCCKDSDQRQALMDLRGKVLGRNRVLLGSETGKMRSPVKIDEALYIETHYDAETLMRILTTRILDMVGYDYSKIRIAVKAE